MSLKKKRPVHALPPHGCAVLGQLGWWLILHRDDIFRGPYDHLGFALIALKDILRARRRGRR